MELYVAIGGRQRASPPEDHSIPAREAAAGATAIALREKGRAHDYKGAELARYIVVSTSEHIPPTFTEIEWCSLGHFTSIASLR